jgi:hypothetical protein
MKTPSLFAGLTLLAMLASQAASAQSPDHDTRPLSPAQIALFMTPHLKNVERPETLQYRFTRAGGSGFEDSVSEHILTIHPDGTKQISFNFLSGDHHKFYPGVDDFVGNPLLMIFLESDVQTMKDTLGVSAAYFRDRIRGALVDQAMIKDATYEQDGVALPAREVTVRPFADDQRLENLPSVQAKTYRFVLCEAIPGGIALMQTSMPADPTRGILAAGETLTFKGVTP